MVRLHVGIVASRIVAADHGPAGLIGDVFSRGMEKIAVEEEHITGIHLDVDKRETLKDSSDAFFVGAGLIPRQYMVDSSEQMRTLDDLKAAVFASDWIDSNGYACLDFPQYCSQYPGERQTRTVSIRKSSQRRQGSERSVPRGDHRNFTNREA